MENVEKKENFKQVCIWAGVVIGGGTPEEFEKYMLKTFSTRVQFLEMILTAPDMKNGDPVKGTGGRSDLFFAVHQDDIEKFSVPRIQAGIRWLEDAIGNHNGGNRLYPKRVEEYKTWQS